MNNLQSLDYLRLLPYEEIAAIAAKIPTLISQARQRRQHCNCARCRRLLLDLLEADLQVSFVLAEKEQEILNAFPIAAALESMNIPFALAANGSILLQPD